LSVCCEPSRIGNLGCMAPVHGARKFRVARASARWPGALAKTGFSPRSLQMNLRLRSSSQVRETATHRQHLRRARYPGIVISFAMGCSRNNFTAYPRVMTETEACIALNMVP
jgi:hypothetical protein